MSFTGKAPNATYKDILQVGNSNNGISTSVTNVKTGDGSSSSLSVSDRALQVKSATNNTAALDVQNASGTSKLLVDTTNSLVKANGINVNTMYKEFGVYDLSPTTGTHHPLICNNMMFSDSGTDFLAITIFGTGADPATTLDVSGHSTYSLSSIATLWYLMDDISIDAIRVLAKSRGDANLNFHVYSYDIDSSTGDLSNGTLLAHIGSVMSTTNTSVKNDALEIDSASVSSGKVIIAFIENETDTSDVSCQLNIKYHITG